MKRNHLLIALIGVVFSLQASATILPRNNLHLKDTGKVANITEAQFNQIIDHIVDRWKPIAKKFGAELLANKDWANSTVNAYAQQTGNVWSVQMFGGLARRPEVTLDGFAMVVCHELGHHFGGYYFYDNSWAAAEGQADYFATQVCGREVFRFSVKTNERFYTKYAHRRRGLLSTCDQAWKTPEDRALCARLAEAGLSLGKLLAVVGGEPPPSIDTPDLSQVSQTNTAHPAAQCRVDTYIAGATCVQNFDLSVIPGKKGEVGSNSVEAEKEAAKVSCFVSNGLETGKRPYCWFKPQI